MAGRITFYLIVLVGIYLIVNISANTIKDVNRGFSFYNGAPLDTAQITDVRSCKCWRCFSAGSRLICEVRH